MTHETIADILIISLTLAVMAGCAVKAHAGAPGPGKQTGIMIERSVSSDLSPAEIRNAAILRADALEAQGIEVDRTALEGLGLNR